MVTFNEIISEEEKPSGPDSERTIYSVGLVAVNPDKVLTLRAETQIGLAGFAADPKRWKGGKLPKGVGPKAEFTTIWLAHNYSTLTVVGSPLSVIQALSA